MAKKFVRGITDIKTITNQDFDTNNVNDLLSDGKNNYIHRKKQDGTEEYHNLTDNLKTVTSDNTDLLEVTNNNDTTNSAVLQPKHDSAKEQSLESIRGTITITHAENGTSETSKVDTNPQKVLEHDNLIAGTYLTKEHSSGDDTLLLKVSDDFITIVNNKQDKVVGKDFSNFSQVQIGEQGNTLEILNPNSCNITFSETLNSQLYQPQETSLLKSDFIIGTFKITTTKDLDTLNVQLATPDGVFHNNIYYNLKADKEYTLYFNTAKLDNINSQNFYLIFKAKNQIQELTTVNISNFNFYVNEYNVNNFNFKTTDFNVSSDDTTPFYDIQNCIEFVKKMIDVDNVPTTINLSNETYEIKMSDNLPYSIYKGANKISIVGQGSGLTKIKKTCTSSNQGKIIDAGGDCLMKGFTIEYIKDPSYTPQTDYGSNPYCIHLDRSPSNDTSAYTTRIEDVVAINEVNAPIGAGLRNNQRLVYKDVTLVNKTSDGVNGALYVHGPNVANAGNCSFEAYDVYAIAENGGYGVKMDSVSGMLQYSDIDCTFKSLAIIEHTPQDYTGFKASHRITKKSFNNTNTNFNY